MKITTTPRLQHETADDAAWAIEVQMPWGYTYEVVEMKTGLPQVPVAFAVKVYGPDDRFLGFAYDPEAEIGFLANVEGLHG